MILRIIKILILSLVIDSQHIKAQNIDRSTLNSLFPTSGKSRVSAQSKNNTTEVQMLFSGLYIFYKKVFSSQDSRKCNFHLSCSDYGITSLKTHGVVGVFHTFDRLTRCNGLNREHYPTLRNNGSLYDPVLQDTIVIRNTGKIIEL
jgi:uncharacterized protein